jgi:hypothetical protein
MPMLSPNGSMASSGRNLGAAMQRLLKDFTVSNLNPDKALIFRITHIENVPWILDHGLHCRNSGQFDPNFKNIGNLELISRRHLRVVPIPPGGTLSDYVPFYFTPFSIMMFNIKTGYGGVSRVPNEDIVIFVSSLRKVSDLGLKFVFTNQHAYPVAAEFFSNLEDLNRIDWPILQARNFKHDPEDPGKKERYQAEALIHDLLPVSALLGIGCHSKTAEARLQIELGRRSLDTRLVVQPQWYF